MKACLIDDTEYAVDRGETNCRGVTEETNCRGVTDEGEEEEEDDDEEQEEEVAGVEPRDEPTDGNSVAALTSLSMHLHSECASEPNMSDYTQYASRKMEMQFQGTVEMQYHLGTKQCRN